MSSKSTMCLMYLLRELMKSSRPHQPQQIRKSEEEKDQMKREVGEEEVFGKDETCSCWRREKKVRLLLEFCREGYSLAFEHGHFLVGNSENRSYIAIPGRFLKAEQPARGDTGFTLWQPLKGCDELYGSTEELEEMPEERLKLIYGYWIAEIDPQTLKLSEPR